MARDREKLTIGYLGILVGERGNSREVGRDGENLGNLYIGL